MKRIFLPIFLAILSTATAFAEGDHRGGWDHHGGGWNRDSGWRGGWIAPLLLGGAIVYDLTYPYTYNVQPTPIYVQPSTAPEVASQPPVQYWYYCRAAKGYYPYVPSCPGGWEAVPAVPPR